MKTTFSLLVLLIFPFWVQAQDTPPDTLATKSIDELRALANQAFRKSDYEGALTVVEAIIEATAKEGPEYQAMYARWCENRALLLGRLGHLDEAIQQFEEILIFWEDKGMESSENHAMAGTSLGAVYSGMGRYDLSLPLHYEAKRKLEALDSIRYSGYSVVLSNIAIDERAAGSSSRATLNAYDELLANTKAVLGKEHPKYGRRLLNLSNYYITDNGDYVKGSRLLAEGYEIVANAVEEKHPEHIYALKQLARGLNDMGNHAAAVEQGRKHAELKLSTQGRKNYEYADAIYLLSIFLVNDGQLDSALYYAELAVELLAENLGTDHRAYPGHCFQWAECLYETGQYQAALAQMEAISQMPSVADGSNTFILIDRFYATLGQYYMRVGQLEKAEIALQKSVEEYEAKFGESHGRTASPYFLLAGLYEKSGKMDAAQAAMATGATNFSNWMTKVLPHFNENQQVNFKSKYAFQQEAIYSFAHRQPQSGQMAATAYDHHLAFKNLLLENRKKLAPENFGNDPALYEDYLAWKDLGETLARQYSRPTDKRSSQLADMEGQYQKLERRLAEASAAFRQNDQRPTVDWRTIQTQLSEGEIVVDVAAFPYYDENLEKTDSVFYTAFLLAKGDAAPRAVFLFEEKQLPRLNSTKALYGNGEKGLKKLFYEPIAPALADVKTIYFGSSGLLHRINLGAIPTGEKEGETLAERFDLRQLGSIRQLAEPENQTDFSKTATVYGGIQYDGSTPAHAATETEETVADIELGNAFRSLRGTDWNYLEWTEKEAEEVSALLRKAGHEVTLLKGTAGHEDHFKQMDEKGTSPRYLHLATHGYFFPEADPEAATGFAASQHPLIRSGLVLAGGNAAWQGQFSDNGEDGILTAYEIAQMDLSGTELVVLSACETGLGDIEGSEGVYGLQRAFKLAGAKYVLMSLWSVNDKKTYEFMTIFYEKHLSGDTIPEAYQKAQAEMRARYALPFNPRNWAGFVLVE